MAVGGAIAVISAVGGVLRLIVDFLDQ